MHWFWRAVIAVAATAIAELAATTIQIHFQVPTAMQSWLSTVLAPIAILWRIVFTSLPLVLFALLSIRKRKAEAETRCRKCGYILRGITEPRCPECGERI
jgi:uncharacterized paraquat-inducible protein A